MLTPSIPRFSHKEITVIIQFSILLLINGNVFINHVLFLINNSVPQLIHAPVCIVLLTGLNMTSLSLIPTFHPIVFPKKYTYWTHLHSGVRRGFLMRAVSRYSGWGLQQFDDNHPLIGMTLATPFRHPQSVGVHFTEKRDINSTNCSCSKICSNMTYTSYGITSYISM